MTALLVVAGEASGDRAAAAVVRRLRGVRAFGLGGGAMGAEGVELVGNLRDWTALGLGEAGARGFRIWRAWRAVEREMHRQKPPVALLVNYTEFNTRLARRLHSAGVGVVWYVAPQVWAWRSQRAAALRPFVDRMALVLPFETALWRRAGVDAHYVGHPALETIALDRTHARRALGMTPYAPAVAILPGSRPHEVRRLLLPMLDAYERVRFDRASLDARILVASGLDDSTQDWIRAQASTRQITTFDVDPRAGAMRVLRAFDAALCASGTAALEAALARAMPVVAYRVGAMTEVAARLLLRTPDIALPNVLLGRRVFAELVQRDVRAARLAPELESALDRRESLTEACDELEAILGASRTPSLAVARMLAPWMPPGSIAS